MRLIPFRRAHSKEQAMMKRTLVVAILLLSLKTANGQDDFKLTKIVPEPSLPPALDVDYSGPLPNDPSVYLNGANWRVWVTRPGDKEPTELNVSGNLVHIPGQTFDSHKLRIRVTGDVPVGVDVLASQWHALFDPPRDAKMLAATYDSTVTITLPPTASSSSSTATPAAPSCDNKPPDPVPYFCPPAAGTPADITVSGSFLAGGGTKPIYAFELNGGIYKVDAVSWLWDFSPGVSVDIEVNQNKQPPNDRTTFNPDSITAALAFQRIVLVLKGPLYGIQLDEALPGGEFSQADPSSNIIFSSSALFALKPLQERDVSAYGKIYPFFGIEAGKNLNKPSMIAMTPVNLSHYDSILRGVVGADAFFGIVSRDDESTDIFSISTTWRTRLPAFDEPFVKTVHQVTTVDLTTKARHWVEVDLNYAPWKFKYISLTAKYQYGDQPPMFNLVDQLFTVGFTFQANQSRKTHLAAE
jgi:hypothetical protein